MSSEGVESFLGTGCHIHFKTFALKHQAEGVANPIVVFNDQNSLHDKMLVTPWKCDEWLLALRYGASHP